MSRVVHNPRRLVFRSGQDMAAHLNVWAATELETPEQWHDAVLASQAWLDYSARNQVLLASYGVDGPVAGGETWKLVPSTTEGRNCAVRAGEHGWPIRVPITTGGSEPDPYLGGTRASRSIADRWEWRPVFEIRQLARRPAPDALRPPEIPATVDDGAFADAAYKVARSTMRGRLRSADGPLELLAEAAGRVTQRSKAPPLEPALRQQAAWIVADRVSQAPGPLPAYDPSPLDPRDRWAQLVAVLDPARKLTGALGNAIGVDLTASPLPRMEIVDDRVVPAGRRRRLPTASFERLPVGRWEVVGPYSADEWAARGEHGSGRGAYLRLNRSAYVVAVENGTEAAWRLEDVAERTGDGLLARGEAPTLDEARHDAVAALGRRYPALAPLAPTLNAPEVRPYKLDGVPQSSVWEPLPGRGRSAAVYRRLTEHVTLYAYPGPGGRWLPVVQNGSIRDGAGIEHLPNAASIDEAKVAAELAGHRAARRAELEVPSRFDDAVARLATSETYSRAALADLLAMRLDSGSVSALADGATSADQLADLLAGAGCTPATTVLVLRAEDVPAAEVARLLPAIGVPMDEGIRVLRDRWSFSATDAADALGATAKEMRDASCTATEIMAVRPRDVLRALPDDARSWELAAVTMSQAGHSDRRVIDHLVAHAPSSETFAASVAALVDDAPKAIATAVNRGARPDQLAALAEGYELGPAETAALLGESGASADITVEAIAIRCGSDEALATDLAVTATGLPREGVIGHLREMQRELTVAAVPDGSGVLVSDDAHATGRIAELESVDPSDPATLLASLPEPGTSNEFHPDNLLALLPEPGDPGAGTLDMTRGNA